jgi:hypothetical protein
MLRIQRQLFRRAEVRRRIAIARGGHLSLGTQLSCCWVFQM